jgi:hypothetical protein
MDAYTIILLGGTGAIWAGILSAVAAYAKQAPHR